MAPSSSSDDNSNGIGSKIGRRTYLGGMAAAAVATGAGAFSSSAVADQHVIEDFEGDDPLADYQGFGVDHADITTDRVYEGEQALIFDWEGDDPVGATLHNPDLGIEADDEIEIYFDNPEVNNFIAVNYLTQDTTPVEGEWDNADSYSIGISAADECLKTWVVEDGDLDEVACEDLPPFLQADGWYRMELNASGGTVTIDLYDDDEDEHLITSEFEDDTYTSGGLGFRGLGNGEVFDHVVYSDAEPEPTPTEEPTPTPTDEPDDDDDDDDDETDDEGVPGFGVVAALAGLGAAGAAAARRFRSDDE